VDREGNNVGMSVGDAAEFRGGGVLTIMSYVTM